MVAHTMERVIAYELIIELLAHQFAFPVQWIETQNTLLADARRLVELGPAKTLLGMAQKSLEHDPTRSVQLLASTQDTSQVCYVYDNEPAEDSSIDEPIIGTPKSSTIPEPIPVPQPAVEAVQIVPDAPLTAIRIFRALIARKLRKSASEIDPCRSIKDLCGGKSTLQNELVGDLGNEFRTLPDRAEDVPLADLDATLGEAPLGPISSALLQRLFTTKMPARLTIPTVRTRLAAVWGLQTQRQTAVLVEALASEPQTRLPSLEAAHQYWDDVAEMYGQSVGLLLHRGNSQQSHEIQHLISHDDSSGARVPSAEAKILARKQLEALQQYLGVPNPTAETDDALASDLQQKLDCWMAEFSDDFLNRVTPCFDARKSRWYRDWWNVARQELLAACLLDREKLDWNNELQDRLCRRAEAGLLQIAQACPPARELVPVLTNHLNVPPKVRLGNEYTSGPRTIVTAAGGIECHEQPRQPPRFTEFFTQWIQARKCKGLVSSDGEDLTLLMLDSLSLASQDGVSFANRAYLLTGAGPGSIGAHVASRLLAGGATVIITTSREPSSAAPFLKQLYDKHASRGSKLHLVPFNQASVVDCQRLIEYIYSNLSLDLHAILPFAATSQVGTEIDSLDSGNEVALRLMLVNVIRLLGFVVTQKRRKAIRCRPTQVVLPLSPNHGILGGDGLYAESKRGLETLLHRLHSESWDKELSICGVGIGWTRSTGLMTTNDLVAETAEKQGEILTFSGTDMGDLITLLLTESWASRCEDAPIMADFSGGLGDWRDAAAQLASARAAIQQRSEIARAIAQEDEREARARRKSAGTEEEERVHPRISLRVGFPRLPDYDSEVQPLQVHIRKDMKLEDTVVIVGFAELGPWGSARLRWEMESQGQLSPAAYVEMAWLMNLIRHVDGPIANEHYVGWVDVQTGEPVADNEIARRYGDTIRSNSGIRPLPSDRSEIFQEIMLEEDLPPFETTKSNAEALRQRHGHNLVRIINDSEGGIADPSSTCKVQLRQGATIRVPKSNMSSPGVAGQLPTGWSPDRYGIPTEIIQQVEPITLALLCCVAEAFYSAGIVNPMEVFEHIHLSELGNFIGSSMGGVINTRALYHGVCLDQDVASDALQETYLNTAPAWVNMLLLGSAGPIKTPVGACATALESVDSAVESIRAGETKICLVGGYDDLQQEEAAGFARMKATVSVTDERSRGRTPNEMSRPTAASRAGFVESQGCGIQLLCRGDVAVAMGLPVYGIVAGIGMASDGIGRSVPAPGQGVLTFAREDHQTPAPLRSALACWGLGIDDLTVASLHATSTPANDTNEPAVIQHEMTHLRRTPGRPLWAICQKSVTGHPKAPAAAWMLNGCLQVLDTGLVPGNRNADDIDPALRAFDHLCFPTHSVQTKGVDAFLLNSCGFGQKEAQMVGVHPRYFFTLQSLDQFQVYQNLVQQRTVRAERAYIRAMMGDRIVRMQSHPPFTPAEMHSILLNPSARFRVNSSTSSYQISESPPPLHPKEQPNDGLPSTVGVDTVTMSTFTAHENAIFIERNYTYRERQFMQRHRDLRSAVASSWCAKEAVFKCLQTVSKGAGASMRDIEIIRSQGAPSVVLHEDALNAAQQAGLNNIQLSLSYGDDCVVAVALGVRR